MNSSFLGPQGSGKGQAGKADPAAHGVPHVSTGDMCPSLQVTEGTEVGLQLSPILESGASVVNGD